MKKRVLSLLFASVAAASVFACGCGSESGGSIIILDGGSAQAQKTAVTVYGHRTDRYSLGVIEDVLQSYMSVNSKASVSYEGAAPVNYWQALDRRYESGNLDDVFMTDRDRLLTLTEKGALADISDAVNENLFNDFARSQIYSVGDAVYAVPASISTYGLYVNYGLLEKHGKQVPRNLSEFTAVCDYFAGEGITPIICNNHSSFRSLILAKGMYSTYGKADAESEIAAFNANPSLLSETLDGGINFVYGMIENGWIDLDEAAVTENLSGDLELFIAGERPFMITGGWVSSTIKEMLDGSGKSLSYGIHAFPVLDSGSVLVAQADSLLSVKKGGNEAEAKAVVSLLTAGSTLLKLSESQSCFTPVKGQTQIYSDSTIIPSASYLTKGKYVIGSDNNLTVPLDGFLDECSEMIADGESAETVKAHLNKLLEEFKV